MAMCRLVKAPEEGKFSFDTTSVKSFTVLDKPIFPTLPVVKTFQLQLVEAVLKAKGIGVFPLKKILTVCVVIGLLWMAWTYLSTHRKQLPQVVIRATNPYQLYMATMTAPDPAEQVEWISRIIWKFTTIPGWTIDSVDFANGLLRASVKSLGGELIYYMNGRARMVQKSKWDKMAFLLQLQRNLIQTTTHYN